MDHALDDAWAQGALAAVVGGCWLKSQGALVNAADEVAKAVPLLIAAE